MEFLKAILGDKYPEFEAAVNTYNESPENKDKQVKLADLGGGGYVSAEKYNKAVTERDNNKTLLETANKALEQFKDVDVTQLQGEITKLKGDLSTKEAEFNTKLTEMEYTGAVSKYFEGYKFTSELAKKAAMEEFKGKALKLENGQFLGGDDFMKQLKEANPTAFVPEDDGTKPPVIVKPTNPRKPGEKMSLQDAMKYANEHPGTDIKTLI
jgi:hypothetical protein